MDSGENNRIRVLVVDDSALMSRQIAGILNDDERIVVVGRAKDGQEALAMVGSLKPDVVTLAVTPQDALVLVWLRQSGIYSEMALRAAGEENADHLTEAVTLQYMLTRFNIAVPPKIEFVMAPSITDLASQVVPVVESTPAPGQ